MAIYKRGKTYWYKFMWRGESIRESTKQGNPRVARQIEAAHKTTLAKGIVGIRERRPVPTLAEFAERDFLPFAYSTFAAKPKTLEYYTNGVKNLLAYEALVKMPMSAITTEKIRGHVAKRQNQGLQVSSINRELEVLRWMLRLASEWGKVEKAPPRVSMLSGERHRERVLTREEETVYLDAAPPLARDVAAILFDCGLRPGECFSLRPENYRDGSIHILDGKTKAARRRIPVTQRVASILDMRLTSLEGDWIFPAPTKSGHIEKSSLRKQHRRACKESDVEAFVLYSIRHTCLTRWAAYMDPHTLAYLAGHSDMATTRRYVHPEDHTVREAMERARSGHKIGHSGTAAVPRQNVEQPTIN